MLLHFLFGVSVTHRHCLVVVKTSLAFIAGRRQDLPGKVPSVLPLLYDYDSL